MKYLLCLLAIGCTAPTLAQRQANWFRLRDVTRAECVVGTVDPAMPTEIHEWCDGLVAP